MNAIKKLTDDEVVALKEKAGGIEIYRFDDDEIGLHVVFKVPNWQNWSAYKRDVVDQDTQLKVIKNMVGAHLVYPSTAEFETFADGRPASVEVVMGEIGEVAGRRTSGVRKKF